MASRSIKNRPDIKKKHPFTGILIALALVAVVGVAGVIGVYALGSSWLKDLPDYAEASAYNTAQKTEVYANDGTTQLASFYVENREPVTLDKISPYILKGTVATEDERFYEHDGVDLWGIGRAFVNNITGSSREGASTITQQFVRATVLSEEANDMSLKRKVREMYISLKLEQMYSKDEILLMYLNTINYGQGAYGIEAAAQTYFSKHATEVTLVEAATLIGIPQSPTYNNPVDNPTSCQERRNLVLSRMLKNAYITQDEYNAASAEPMTLVLQQQSSDGIYLYPYFTSYVRDTLLKQFSEAEVFKGGLKVYTTLDPSMQVAAEKAARNKEATLADDIEVALTAVDPNTGFIKAMVGGKDFYTNQYNLATQGKRSCGSSFKTFTLVSALEKGISPSTYISCSSRVTLGNWSPENYGGAEYGTKTIAGAFAVSSNTAFARLITALGADEVVETAHKLGIKSDLPALPAITLGTVDVSTDEMAGAYATIANGGTQRDVTGIERVVNHSGTTIYESNTTGKRVITEEIAYATTKVMEGVVTNGTGTAAALSSGQPVAGKTGTSEDWKDSYFAGFTPQISVAIWLGARQPRLMPASYTATSVFRDFVGTVLKDQPIKDFAKAADPTYKPFSDSKLQIGSSWGSSGSSGGGNSSSSSNATTPDAGTTNDATTNTQENTNDTSTPSGGSSTGGGSNSNSGSGTNPGGGSTNPGGGSTGGGSSGGSSGGGSSGGGSSGG